MVPSLRDTFLNARSTSQPLVSPLWRPSTRRTTSQSMKLRFTEQCRAINWLLKFQFHETRRVINFPRNSWQYRTKYRKERATYLHWNFKGTFVILGLADDGRRLKLRISTFISSTGISCEHCCEFISIHAELGNCVILGRRI